MGERSEDALAKLIPEGVRYVGVGVGKRWGRNFMKAAADRTGGYFTQINPDESITWRAFDLLATLNTPRLMELRVVDDAERAAFLCDATSLAQGEEIFAVTRVKKGAALPEAVTVAGKLDGKPFVRRIRVREVAEGAGYLPRTWAKLEIDRLLAEDGAKHKNTVVELSKAMYVMSPYTSLLVLETDADYERFKVDRGRKDHWAMYASPARIPIVHEPLWTTRQGAPQAQGQKRSVAQVLSTVLIRVPPQPLSPAGKPNNNPLQAVSALPLYFGAFALPTTGEEFGVEIGLQAPIVYRHGFDFNASEPMEWSDQPLKDRTIGFKGLRYLGANRSPYLNLLKGEAPAWNYYHLVRPDTTAARIGLSRTDFSPNRVSGSESPNWRDGMPLCCGPSTAGTKTAGSPRTPCERISCGSGLRTAAALQRGNSRRRKNWTASSSGNGS